MCVAFMGSAPAAPITLEGMGIVNQWTDFENQVGELPADVWGTSDATAEDRVGIHVEFVNGLVGSATYSGVSGLWNTIFAGITADTTTGFFNTVTNLHFLFNNGVTLPMAWTPNWGMAFSSNFDLDYTNSFGSHFRANVAGWQSAVFTTYSSAVSASVPEPGTLALLGIGLAGMGLARRRKKV